MKRVRRRDTRPELLLRRELHHLGLRYRVDTSPLGGRRRADVVFTKQRVAVFVDGCFWHVCPVHGTTPKSNSEFWEAKLTANQRRDRATDTELIAAGWRVVRVWEHADMALEAAKVQATVSPPEANSPS
jgi:DNA mismatch endonuclease (patch repair protein)